MIEPTGYTALDLIGFTDRGYFDPSATYVKNDLVHDDNESIWRVLIDDTSGVIPTEGLNYTIFIRNPQDAAKQIIAPVETSPTANAHAAGTQIIYHDVLYDVTTAIADGGALVVYPTSGYNIKPAPLVTSQIQALANNKADKTVVSKIADGLTPKLPNETTTTKYLRQDGTWQVPPDTNTWRGIQNNLTSDSTTDSLSAAQGKALKSAVDGKAPTSHASTGTGYGAGNASNYGHVKVSDNYTSSAGNASQSVAASSKAVNDVYTTLSNNKVDNARYPDSIKTFSAITDGTTKGISINYDPSIGFSVFYFDTKNRVALITKLSSQVPTCIMLNSNFENTVFGETASQFRIGNYTRATLIVNSGSINSILVTIY